MFIDVSDSVTRTLMFGNAVKKLSRVLKKNQQASVIHRMELFERITAEKVALAHQLTGMPPMPPKSAWAIDIWDKKLEEILWLFH